MQWSLIHLRTGLDNVSLMPFQAHWLRLATHKSIARRILIRGYQVDQYSIDDVSQISCCINVRLTKRHICASPPIIYWGNHQRLSNCINDDLYNNCASKTHSTLKDHAAIRLVMDANDDYCQNIPLSRLRLNKTIFWCCLFQLTGVNLSVPFQNAGAPILPPRLQLAHIRPIINAHYEATQRLQNHEMLQRQRSQRLTSLNTSKSPHRRFIPD